MSTVTFIIERDHPHYHGGEGCEKNIKGWEKG